MPDIMQTITPNTQDLGITNDALTSAPTRFPTFSNVPQYDTYHQVDTLKCVGVSRPLLI